MIKLENIEKSYGDLRVLDGISLSVEDGEVVALIGPSGTGKTTLLRSINFLSRTDKGTITIGDKTVSYQKASNEDVIEMRRRTGMVFQNYNLFTHMTILENVMEGLVTVQKKSKEEAEEIALREIERVNLLEQIDKYPKELSGGQQQRIGIARAMALNPEVMLLDEPTSSLDPEGSADILKTLQELAKLGTTMILATHEMEFAKYVSDRVVFMENGKIVEQGPPEQIFNHPKEKRTEDFVRRFEHSFLTEEAEAEG